MHAEALKVDWVDVRGAGKGLVACEDLPIYTPLLSIPLTALLNVSTLTPHFPAGILPSRNTLQPALTASQSISLYLARHRRSSDGPWAPYLKVLPRDFEWHPLSWWLSDANSEDHRTTGKDLLFRTPPSARKALDEASERFMSDWKDVEKILADERGKLDLGYHVAMEDFLWGWLILNTRSVYYTLGLPRIEDNMTLAPILDMLNHSPSGLSDLEITRTSLLLSSPDRLVRKGDELYLRYGGHSNVTLYAEYGFVLAEGNDELWQADVEDLILPRFDRLGKEGRDKLAMLEKSEYRKDLMLYYHPAPAHPSYCLIVALRLLHCSPRNASLAAWSESLQGTVEFADAYPEIDRVAKATLLDICEETTEIGCGEEVPWTFFTVLNRPLPAGWFFTGVIYSS